MANRVYFSPIIRYNRKNNKKVGVVHLPLTCNIVGLLNSLNLPVSKCLWPLFETVVNAIQSIEESKNSINGKIVITAKRMYEEKILKQDNAETPFDSFSVSDNGDGFNKRNYDSFEKVYSTLKLNKGCKGIGRFLWLKAFRNIFINSTFEENNTWYNRTFDFSIKNKADDVIRPEDNLKKIEPDSDMHTVVHLEGFIDKYQKKAPIELKSLAKKIIEHCLLYFLNDHCPSIILRDDINPDIDLNKMFAEDIKKTLKQSSVSIKGEKFKLYHLKLYENANAHQVHLCADTRDVKICDLSKSKSYPNLQGKLIDNKGERSFYYTGFLTGDFLNQNVNSNRTGIYFGDGDSLFNNLTEENLIDSIKPYIDNYLCNELKVIVEKKTNYINSFVREEEPKYRYLLNQKPEIYNSIPANLSPEKLELELHKKSQEWELELSQQAQTIKGKIKMGEFNNEDFAAIFNQYCQGITDISKSSLAEYVTRRRTILDLLEEALTKKDDGSYYSEATLHSIICPMRHTSDDISFEEMNLWIIDDRLSYHSFLASDKSMKSLPVVDVNSDKRMDLAIFNHAISYSEQSDLLNSISIIEFKRPNRNDLKDDNDPIKQVLGYAKNIRNGKVKKANGRPFINVEHTAFYCYIIAELTSSMRDNAGFASLTKYPDNEGYFGYNPEGHAYIEVISYEKLLRDAKQRNKILFDKLFNPDIEKTLNGKLLTDIDAQGNIAQMK